MFILYIKTPNMALEIDRVSALTIGLGLFNSKGRVI